MGYIEGQDRKQKIFFPESIDDYLNENSNVRIIDEYIELLDGIKNGITPYVTKQIYSNGTVINFDTTKRVTYTYVLPVKNYIIQETEKKAAR